MLIIKAYVNNEQIDEIQVQNMGAPTNAPGWDSLRNYKIGYPKIKQVDGIWVQHNREEGWMVLAKKVLDKILSKGAENE